MYKRHRYPRVIIQQAVYFKLRFSLSYRDVEELMQLRGVDVDHSTIQRWVFKFSPEFEKKMNKRKHRTGDSWRMDETYVKVAGQDRFLYRAVDKQGNTVDFLLTKRRQRMSAQKCQKKNHKYARIQSVRVSTTNAGRDRGGEYYKKESINKSRKNELQNVRFFDCLKIKTLEFISGKNS